MIGGRPGRPELLRTLGAGYRVQRADGLAAALDALRSGGFDAVLLDADLPGDCAEAVRRVRESAPGAALLVVADDAAGAAAGLDADERVAPDDGPRVLARCVAGAIERRRLRAQREASEARFRSIIQRTADGIVIVGRDGRVRFVNPAAERLFGRGAAELAGEHFGISSHAGETTEIDIVRRGEAEPLVAELRASDTTWEGEAAQVISLRDVTDRRRAEERKRRLLLEQAARAEAERAARRSRFLAEAGAALDASLDAEANLSALVRLVAPRMADWCVVDLLEGERVRRVAGVHAAEEKEGVLREMGSRYPLRLDSPLPTARVLRTGAPELRGGLDSGAVRGMAVDDGHARLLVDAGFRSTMVVPLTASGQLLGAVTFACGERDFDQHDLELAMELAGRAGRALENSRLYAAALEASRAKSDFLAVMSHELRTPLNAVLGYAEILLDGVTGSLQERQAEQLRRIQASAMHLLQMIEEILAYADLEAGRNEPRPRPVRLGELVEGVAAVAEPLARDKGLELAVEVPRPDAALFTDDGKLHRILLNLLTNAVKFTPSGTVRLRAEVDDGELVAAVSDTGTGIPHENMETIFEPFWQAGQPLTRRTGGTGLGLTVSRRLAQVLGGSLTAESRPGAGSTFAVRVPARLPSN